MVYMTEVVSTEQALSDIRRTEWHPTHDETEEN